MQTQHQNLEATGSLGLDSLAIDDYLVFREEIAPVLAQEGYELPPFDPYSPIADPLPPMDPSVEPGGTLQSTAEACFGAISAADAAILAATRICSRGPTVACAYATAAAVAAVGTAILTCELYLRKFEQME
ncbi:MAG: hypothetical protein Kow0020_05550 [Wenzhouxiangellaceae bacterium]